VFGLFFCVRLQDETVAADDKLRLLSLYFVSQPIDQQVPRQTLFDAVKPPLTLQAQNALINLKHLGVVLGSVSASEFPRKALAIGSTAPSALVESIFP
jgi:hypothetical protein